MTDVRRCSKRQLDPMSLTDFVAANDFQFYGVSTVLVSAEQKQGKANGSSASSGIAHLLPRAHLQILNQYSSVSAYYAFLDTLDFASPIRLRPTWDAYFMTLASLASLRSNCMKRRVGCVLVHNARIISTGYNGTPRNLTNCNEGGCDRCNSARQGGVGIAT